MNATKTSVRKPTPLGVHSDSIPKELRDRPQWVLWRQESRNGDKPTKVPYAASNRRHASTTDSTTWTTFDVVDRAYRKGGGRYAGIGFVFTKEDPFIGIDLDDCRDSATGEIEPWGQRIIERLSTYAEVSPSGAGVKLWARGKLPTESTGKKRPWENGGVEMYQRKRYFAVTGQHVEGTPLEILDAQKTIDELWSEIFGDDAAPDHAAGEAIPRLSNSDDRRVVDRAAKYLAKIPPAVSGQGGHDATFHAACVLVAGFNLSPDRAYPLLAEWNQTCEPPWSVRDLLHKLKGANEQSGERGYLLNATPAPNGQARHYQSRSDGTTATAGADEPPKQNIVNATFEGSGEDRKTVSLTMEEVLLLIRDATDGWPCRVANSLFVHDDHGLGWLANPAALFGWLSSRTGSVHWRRGVGCITKDEVFHELRRTARQYEAVEELPHEPRMEDHYYACDFPKPGNGDTLRRLLARYNPETDIDRDLMQAALMTLFWGGPAGCRPCFVITSDDGRGAGKTKFAETICQLAGGALSFSHNEEIGKIKTRLLSPDALSKRGSLLDNLKSLKFSWGELESLITAMLIGGHRMYTGEATTPNTLTWFITLNGASLSTDMAQRSVVIKIKKPKRTGAWEEETVDFIERNRERLIGDLIGCLQSEPATLDSFSRWASWDRSVLSRLPEPAEAQKVIAERQAAVDVEADEANELHDFFADQLRRLSYDPEGEQVHIPSQVAARWFNWANNENQRPVSVSRLLNQWIGEGRIRWLRRNRCNAWGKGFIWQQTDCNAEQSVEIDIRKRLAEQQQR